MKLLQIILLFMFIPFFSEGQVLLNLLDNDMHSKTANTYKQNNIKRIYYTTDMPFLLFFGLSSKGKDSSSFATDTITHSEYFLKSGLIESEKQTLPNGNIYYLKEYYFDSTGNLIKTTELNNQRLRYNDYQQMVYHYREGKINRIDKMFFKNTDTVKTTTRFYYSGNKLVKVFEANNKTGDSLLSSYFTYYPRKNYIAEKSFKKEFCEVRANYYYKLDGTGRIVKVSHGLKGYHDRQYPDRKISYHFSDLIPKTDGPVSLFSVEKYDSP